MMNIIILIVFLTVIILDSTGDSLMDSKRNKELSHLLKAINTGIFILLPFFLKVELNDILWYVIGYTLLRFSLFDYIYNLISKLPFNYIGKTSYYDKLLNKINPGSFIFARVIALVAGIHIIITKL